MRVLRTIAVLLAVASLRCGTAEKRPNVLWILWDTVRADRLSLYGYEKNTTPFLDAWAAEARVFDDCVSAANYTVSSHASFFTGLFPTEHGARNGYLHLDEEHVTIAELLRDAGYRTYLWSANPHISEAENFDQGFETAEHPWSADFLEDAIAIVKAKIRPEDRSSELPEKFRASRVGSWDIKASGALAEKALTRWLRRDETNRPWFAFLNYMEAHRPYVPPREYRLRVMTEEQVARSYRVDRSWVPLWSYTFGLRGYDDEELAVMAGKYEATLVELDDLFRGLIERLEAEGHLENTVVIVGSDHGEHLGQNHILGHQYSLHQALVKVPLVVRDPVRFPPGREERPVMTQDLFPTILEIAGVAPPPREGPGPVSLRAPQEDRVRVAECLGVFRDPFHAVGAIFPDWESAPWEREIRAVYVGDRKLIRWSDGEAKLFDLAADPGENDDIAPAEPERVAGLEETLAAIVGFWKAGGGAEGTHPDMSKEHVELLRSLGYVYDDTLPDETGEE